MKQEGVIDGIADFIDPQILTIVDKIVNPTERNEKQLHQCRPIVPPLAADRTGKPVPIGVESLVGRQFVRPDKALPALAADMWSDSAVPLEMALQTCCD